MPKKPPHRPFSCSSRSCGCRGRAGVGETSGRGSPAADTLFLRWCLCRLLRGSALSTNTLQPTAGGRPGQVLLRASKRCHLCPQLWEPSAFRTLFLAQTRPGPFKRAVSKPNPTPSSPTTTCSARHALSPQLPGPAAVCPKHRPCGCSLTVLGRLLPHCQVGFGPVVTPRKGCPWAGTRLVEWMPLHALASRIWLWSVPC